MAGETVSEEKNAMEVRVGTAEDKKNDGTTTACVVSSKTLEAVKFDLTTITPCDTFALRTLEQ